MCPHTGVAWLCGADNGEPPPLQRMCVLACALDNPKVLHVYVKGAPEKVKDLCRPETGTGEYSI